MGAFVFGLEGDDRSIFDRTLEFVYETGIDLVVANIIQPYPGTGTFKDATVGNDFLPWPTARKGRTLRWTTTGPSSTAPTFWSAPGG